MIPRTLEATLRRVTGPFPVVFLTGPRQSGKTTLARATFPDFEYLSLEDVQTRQEAHDDPRGFLRRLEGRTGLIFDEAQRVPDLFSYLQGFVDDRRGGPVVLTGSQNFLLTRAIGQSLAGRVAALELHPFSLAEMLRRESLGPASLAEGALPAGTPPPWRLDEALYRGFFPPVHDRDLPPTLWYDGYVRTYLERDVRLVGGVGDLDTFLRFLRLCAGRTGQILNVSALGDDAGVSHATARNWLSILRASYVLDLLQPHFQNFAKRLVKSPKLHFLDVGLACFLLGVRSPDDLRTHPLRGALVESFVVAELRKLFRHHGETPPLYYWRDTHGHEVDILVDLGTRRVPIEVKAGVTVASEFFRSLEYYQELSGCGPGMLVYGGDDSYERQGHRVRGWWEVG